jgi:hypothetical protein
MARLASGCLHTVKQVGVMFLQFGFNEAVFADLQTAGLDQGRDAGRQVVAQEIFGNLGTAEHGFEEMVMRVV